MTSAPQVLPPPEVAGVAEERRFGSLLGHRALSNPLASAAMGLVATVACFVMIYVVAHVAANIDHFSFWYSIVRATGLFFLLTGVGALVYAVKRIFVGARSYWAFSSGFVYRHNKRVQAFAWTEIAALSPVIGTKGDAAGKVTHYNLIPLGGAPISLPLHIENGHDPFMDVIIAELQRHGRPVS